MPRIPEKTRLCRQIGVALNYQNPPPHRNRSDRADDSGRWVCVATAPDQLVAELWQQLLREESIPSMLAPQDTVSFLGVSSSPVRLMVPAASRSRAEEVLDSIRRDPADLP